MNQIEVRFGQFLLDLRQRKLTRDGEPVQLGSRALDILCVLASARGAVVSKDDLMAQVWPGTIVEENNIQVHVSALRKVLQEGKSGESCLVTVPGRGYRLIGLHIQPQVAIGDTDHRLGPVLPDKPSIAVLPFQNLSADPEQEYFADGIVEEIITALSRFSGLFVIARNSSFTYKGRAVDVKQVGHELGVRYVLEGSLRKSANRVRITGQLIDASTGAHIWADRFDGALDDIFDLQDQVTATVVAAISPKLEQAEIERIKHKPTESLDAYDCFLRGMANTHELLKEPTNDALRLFYLAIERDPDFASAYGMATWCYVQRKANRWMTDGSQEVAEALRLARRAVNLGKHDAVALSTAGHALSYVACDLDGGAVFVERALALNPNLAFAWFARAWSRTWLGEPDKAISDFAHVVRLSPLEPLMPNILAGLALGHFIAGQYDEAATLAAQVLREKPELHVALRVAAASNALAGHMMEAHEAMARLRQIDPVLRVSDLKVLTPFRRPEDVARYEEGLRKAGLPK
jgi:TolB-like protein/tetratricopeptide (TPR) repeat protein